MLTTAVVADANAVNVVPNSVLGGMKLAQYVVQQAQDKGQFLPDGMMPASGPATVLAIEKFVGNVTGPVNLATTYTNQYAITANKLEGFTK